MSSYSLLAGAALARWELLLVAAIVAILVVARWLPELLDGLRRGGFEFRKELDRQAHDAGKSAGGIGGKPAAEALTPDNQTAELYDPAVFRPHGKKRTCHQGLRDLWLNLLARFRNNPQQRRGRRVWPNMKSPEQKRIHELVGKIVAYQESVADGRAVALEELRREGILDAGDVEFLSTHSITYKPHRLGDYHALDMFHMPTEDGGCVFVGPGSRSLKKRRARLQELQPILESFLQLPRPREELLLHIDFSVDDGMAVSPVMICFNLRSGDWRARLPAIRTVAAEVGLMPAQDEPTQEGHTLLFPSGADPFGTARAAVALLRRGCGLVDQAEIRYSAGALDEVDGD